MGRSASDCQCCGRGSTGAPLSCSGGRAHPVHILCGGFNDLDARRRIHTRGKRTSYIPTTCTRRRPAGRGLGQALRAAPSPIRTPQQPPRVALCVRGRPGATGAGAARRVAPEHLVHADAHEVAVALRREQLEKLRQDGVLAVRRLVLDIEHVDAPSVEGPHAQDGKLLRGSRVESTTPGGARRAQGGAGQGGANRAARAPATRHRCSRTRWCSPSGGGRRAAARASRPWSPRGRR